MHRVRVCVQVPGVTKRFRIIVLVVYLTSFFSVHLRPPGASDVTLHRCTSYSLKHTFSEPGKMARPIERLRIIVGTLSASTIRDTELLVNVKLRVVPCTWHLIVLQMQSEVIYHYQATKCTWLGDACVTLGPEALGFNATCAYTE